MNIPVRGIQIALLIASFVHFLGWAMELSSLVNDKVTRQIVFEDGGEGVIARLCYEFAYMFFYLGEVAIIELLHRIWISFQTRSGTKTQ